MPGDATDDREANPRKPEPVGERQRIAALDVLRGLALLGILGMNIRSFAGPFSTYLNPLVMYDYSGISRLAYWVTTLLFDTKMISLFSMLFGAGALLYAEKRSEPEVSTTRLWYRRNVWLLLIGLAHAYLVWEGDILVVYSLCGLLFVWWTRRLSVRALVILSAAMFSVGGFLSIGHAAGFADQPPAAQAEELALWQPSAGQLADEVNVYRDGYFGIVKHRAPLAFVAHTLFFVVFFLWRAGGMMVLGQGLLKSGVLTGGRTIRFYRALAIVGYAVGFPLVWTGQWQLEAAEFAVPQRFTLDLYNYFGSIAVALGHVGLVLWLYRSRTLPGCFDRLAAVGRMALTNYLMQSLICTTLFYGYGCGLFGRLNYAWQLVVVIAIWVLQLLVSPWWLKRHPFGPAEWFWRRLTYRARPPITRV